MLEPMGGKVLKEEVGYERTAAGRWKIRGSGAETFYAWCPKCGKRFKARVEHEGKRAQCTGCGWKWVVWKERGPRIEEQVKRVVGLQPVPIYEKERRGRGWAWRESFERVGQGAPEDGTRQSPAGVAG